MAPDATKPDYLHLQTIFNICTSALIKSPAFFDTHLQAFL